MFTLRVFTFSAFIAKVNAALKALSPIVVTSHDWCQNEHRFLLPWNFHQWKVKVINNWTFTHVLPTEYPNF